jgi:hypothetical protein
MNIFCTLIQGAKASTSKQKQVLVSQKQVNIYIYSMVRFRYFDFLHGDDPAIVLGAPLLARPLANVPEPARSLGILLRHAREGVSAHVG